MKEWLQEHIEDLIFAGFIALLAFLLVFLSLLGAHRLVRDKLELRSQKVVTIPLVEIEKCHDRKGVIRVKDGKWTCEAAN